MDALAVRERPILFSAPMVRAILAGSKTQTRRIMRVQPPSSDYEFSTLGSTTGPKKDVGRHHWLKRDGLKVIDGRQPYFSCPYGYSGDRLWVRETHWINVEEHLVAYRADGEMPEHIKGEKWKPSIFTPRWASRITLEVTDVRVQRLQDISHHDALAEGVEYDVSEEEGSPLARFETLWKSINGVSSWNANPYVWAVSFEQVR